MGWLLLPFLLFLLYFPSHIASLCNLHDSSALLQFKNSHAPYTPDYDFPWWSLCSSFRTRPITPKTESWKNGTDCCEWDGVTCDTISGHVIGLDVSCSNLHGKLHPNSTIFSLRHLQQLNLAYNFFYGSSIYSGIGDLVNLTHLNLGYTGIGGDIPPTISHLSKLVSLDLSYYTSDADPSSPRMRLDPYTWTKLIHNATSLRELLLDRVDMSCIRESSLSLLTNLSSSLLSLSLSATDLQGNFPTDILCLSNLRHLSSFYNENLRAELPKSNWTTPLRYLDLSYTAFSGNIPDSIVHLKSLNTLSLASCNFDGLVPSSFFTLTQLSDLDLSYNKLVGPIPSEINKLPKLSSINLSHNMLNGTIPPWCFSLPSLLVFDLSHNQLIGSIGEISTYSLKRLDLSNNKLQGDFPNSIFELQNLTDLILSSNDLSGQVDFLQFSKLKNLFSLHLSYNSFVSINYDDSVDYFLPNLYSLHLSSCNISSFPKFLARVPDLLDLDLSHNHIRGSIPKWFRELLHSWENIDSIDLSFNKLEGDLLIPPSAIRLFFVSNNKFTGHISSKMCNASSLEMLNFAHNNLAGQIPQCLGTLPSLSVLDFQMNNLHGNMPWNFSKGNSFETIKLNGNRLVGQLPQSLAHCRKLQVLDLENNNIEDTFPHWLETLQELQVLSLRSNKFHGVITCFGTNHSFPALRILDVSDNNFSGPLPASCIKNFQGMMNVNDSQNGLNYMDKYLYNVQGMMNGNDSQNGLNYMDKYLYNDSVVVVMKGQSMDLVKILFAFTTIDLSNNMFEGEIPKVIGELHSLKGLNLSHNSITGTIPPSLGNLRNLESLDLSWNQLMGEIPLALTNLNFLAVLNLSQNQFEGIIPTGKQFNTFVNDSYAGNPMLCGFPLSKSCNKDEEWPPPHSTFQHEESGFGWKAVAVGFACGVVYGMLLGYNVFMTGKPQCLVRLVEGMFK